MKSTIGLFVAWIIFAMVTSKVFGGTVTEGSFNEAGTGETVSVSSFTLTKVPTTQDDGRVGFFVSISSTNAGALVGFAGDCSAAQYANTVRPIRVNPGSNSVWYKFNQGVCLWLINTGGAGAENAHVQQMYQDR
jgi:hypothetical protein